MGLHIFRSTLFRCLHLRLNYRVRSATRELAPQLRNDRLSEFGLHREHVLQITRVIFRPELLARVGAGEARCNAHVVAGLAHAPIDKTCHAQFLSDLLRGRILAFERKCRCSRGHPQSGNFLQYG